MSIGPVSRIEELIDIMADDRPWLLILCLVLAAGLLSLGFYSYFWPVISGQPEYSEVRVLQEPGIGYDVLALLPERIEPEEQYTLQVEIVQNVVLTTPQQITATIRPLSPFIELVSDSQAETTAARSFSVMAWTSEPQRFSHAVSIAVMRPANRLRSLPIEVGLDCGNVYHTQEIELRVDYWSRLVVGLVTGGALVGFLSFTVRLARSLLGI